MPSQTRPARRRVGQPGRPPRRWRRSPHQGLGSRRGRAVALDRRRRCRRPVRSSIAVRPHGRAPTTDSETAPSTSPTRSRTVPYAPATAAGRSQDQEQRQEAQADQQGELPRVDRHQHRRDHQLPELTSISSPPHCMNVEMVSTSLVTRETSDPRRSAFWVSTDRSWTCRNARTRRRRQPGLGRAEEPHVEEVRRTGRGHQGRRRGERDRDVHPAEVRTAVGDQPLVDRLLDGDRHQDPPGGGHQGEQQGDRQPGRELRGQRQPAPEGRPGARLVAAGRRRSWSSPVPGGHAAPVGVDGPGRDHPARSLRWDDGSTRRDDRAAGRPVRRQRPGRQLTRRGVARRAGAVVDAELGDGHLAVPTGSPMDPSEADPADPMADTRPSRPSTSAATPRPSSST